MDIEMEMEYAVDMDIDSSADMDIDYYLSYL